MRINRDWRVAMLAVVLTGTAAAESGRDFDRETLTGAWGGQRQALSDAGWRFDGVYKADFLRLMRGGMRRGAGALGHLDLSLDIDLDKVAGWQETRAFINYLHNHGDDFNTQRMGSQLGVTNIEVPVDTHRIFHAWVEKSWAEGRFAVLAGLYPIDSEFQVVESAGLFIQPPYGPTGDVSLSRGPSIFNNSAVGMRARWLAPDRGFYVQGAVLDGIPGDPNRPRGTHIVFGENDGTMQIAEIGTRRELPGDVPDGEAVLQAKYAFGVWNYSEMMDDLVDLDAAGNPLPRRSQGAYMLAERLLWLETEGRSGVGFVRLGGNDGHANPIRRIVNVGLTVTAPFASRPDDVFGVAYTHARIAPKYQQAQAAAGSPSTAAETTWEVTYRYAVSPWLAVQPVLQWYRHPGAATAVPDATVAGVRVELAF